MKDAVDYAQQALRFAARSLTWAEADELAHAWQDAYEDGQRTARQKDASVRSREAFAYECPREAEEALAKKSRRLLIEEYCEGCGACVKRCSQGALRLEGGRSTVDPSRCVLCGYCAKVCPMFAIKVI